MASDLWGTDSGLLDNFEGTIAEAWFGTDERSDDPTRVYAFWKFVDIVTEDGEQIDEWTVRLSLGSGWEAIEDGQEVVRADGNTKKKVNQNTDLGRIINRMVGENGGGQEGKEYGEAFDGVLETIEQRHGSDASPLQAQVYEGLRFKMEGQTFSFTDRETGEKVEYGRTLPVAFLGTADDPTSASGGEEASNGNGDDKVARIKLEAALKELARTKDSHGEFLEAALAVDGVATDDDLLAKVADDSDSGLYAAARS